MTSGRIVDAHHHFWRVSRGDYHWMSPDMGLPLYRDYLPEDMTPLLRKCGIDYTVVVQAAETEAETDFLLTLAQETDFVAGVVGWLNMEDDQFEAKLDVLCRSPKFVGLRPMNLAIETVAEILDGKEVKDRLPIPLTVVTMENVNSVEPAF